MTDVFRSYKSWLGFPFPYVSDKHKTWSENKKVKENKINKHPFRWSANEREKKIQTLWDYFHYVKVHILFLLSVSFMN